jgi:hypothetical protein
MIARDNGKGDKPRPIKDWDRFKSNWDEIFKKKEQDEKQKTVPRN